MGDPSVNEDVESVPDTKVNAFRLPGKSFTVCGCIKAATIELYVGLTTLVLTMMSTPMQELIKQKACLQYYNVSLNTCQAMFANETWDSEVKSGVTRVTTSYGMYGEVASLGPAVLLGLFTGPWSDHYGRKIPMVVATLGTAIKILGVILNVVYFDLPLPWILLPQLIMGISGGLLMMIGSTYSLVSEQTTEANRALKFFSLEVCLTFAGPIGSLLSGQLYKSYGFLAVFLTSEAVALLSLLVVVVLIREAGKTRATAGTMLRDLFSLKNIKENVNTGLLKRPHRVRQQLWVLILAMCVIILCLAGPMVINYLYVVHNLGWSLEYYTIVETVGSLSCSLVMIPIMVVLTKIKKVPDYFLGLLGCSSQAAQNFFRASVSNEWIKGPHWLYYLAFPTGMAGAVSSVAVRSRLSMLVSKEELGKVFCLLVTCESMTPLVGMVLFPSLFNMALDYFSGLPFLVAACLIIVPTLCFIWVSRIPLPHYANLEKEDAMPGAEVKDVIADSKSEHKT